MKFTTSLLVLIFQGFFLFTYSSCSFWERRNSLENENTKDFSQDVSFGEFDKNAKLVPREQYEALLKRYKALAMSAAITQGQMQEDGAASLRGPDGVTVEQGKQTPLEEQIALMKKGLSHLKAQDTTLAFNLFRNLEYSPHLPIKIRAKYYIAQILYEQKSLDLALEVYEEITAQYPESGYALLATTKIIECAKLLQLREKMLQYSKIYKEKYFQALGEWKGDE